MRNRHIVRYLILSGFGIALWILWSLQKDFNPIESLYRHTDSSVHPIQRLFEDARSKHTLILNQQSQNVDEARSEYRRRYEIDPPEGFNDWYQYAKKRRSPIIDDFDELMDSLRPFRAYQTAKCDYQHVQHKHPALMTVCVKKGAVELGNPNPSPYDKKQIVTPLQDLLSEFVKDLPDMCFYLNTFDEPRHVIPLDQEAEIASETSLDSCEDHDFHTTKRKDVWRDITKFCPQDSAAILGSQSYLNPEEPLNWKFATDLCSFPDAPPSGIIRAPDTSSLTSGPRPILSAAKLSTFADILFPTLWRWRFNIDHPNSISWAQLDDNTTWADKRPQLGWRGSSTGGYASGSNWHKFQRHQMVLFASNTSNPNLPPKLQHWLDIRFTSVTGCEDKTCEAIKAELPLAPSQTLSETFQNRIVLDMDGHGLSGRFYMLLQSNSAVMKQGLVREWHDSRLQPWLHYIPLSMEMAELEQVLEYFFGEGDHVLQAIAEAGRDWVRQALRREDMRVYMYRLLLELGRRTF